MGGNGNVASDSRRTSLLRKTTITVMTLPEPAGGAVEMVYSWDK